jgi:60 kDa SS-A/Ro ribonucleoprotein
VPSESLNSPEVWEALLHAGGGMPLGALVRNLGKMGAVGLLRPLSEASSTVASRLRDADEIRRARLHPIAILTALRVYASGHGIKGDNRWTPDPRVVDALDDAFYLAFGNVAPTGRRLLIGVDWSGSMEGVQVAPGITAATAAAAMALVHATIEPETFVLCFGTTARPVTLSPSMRLDDVIRVATSQTGEGTDCALPFRYARENGLDADGFIVLTDNATWAGREHPIEALRAYRRKSGRGAVAVASAFAATVCSILPDDEDAGCLNVAGFDAAAPMVVADFLRARS